MTTLYEAVKEMVDEYKDLLDEALYYKAVDESDGSGMGYMPTYFGFREWLEKHEDELKQVPGNFFIHTYDSGYDER